jgi:hypothetical protein
MKYSFLLISNKFCDLSLLHWLLFRGVIEMWGCSVVRKMYCTGPSKLATIPLYNPIKSHVGVHVHKITYGPLLVTALYVMLLMRANPLGGQVGEGCALEIEIFSGLVNWAQKSMWPYKS